ncbi:UvrD-helicase domain-containing protein [Amycolatopsis sp. BJA-103]|uniref:UvrD-helicase domain-containing protein n=1 Tax=Amycolatopsis sp. BJA-103 TaxID=1911175 RepID=UPI000C77CACD|nr:UvrD-helicase domain-containing protein [Amycolatopsis sp. BJA-103]AUI61747.1 DNA helicase UvrD [Amycolatopsis sp. BJA-103]PNE20956.1 DNA helicase UvrD [Amycolatopsis sp. BJA-103]
MPTIIMGKLASKIDGSIRSKAMAFLQKLGTDDTTSGLHIEPIENAADPRVRTGRVDNFWRAVMFRLDSDGERHYVIHGIWPHDDAIAEARRVRLSVNPINGLPQIAEIEPPIESVPAVTKSSASQSLLVSLGHDRNTLVETLGLPEHVVSQAIDAVDEDAVLDLAQQHDGWIGTILVDLAAGDTVDSVVARLELAKAAPSGNADADVLHSLKRPGAAFQYAMIGDQDELRRVIEGGDFGAWRIFLHPEQLRYVERSYNGPFRLSGGAGTGKTVVLVHRARALARRNPNARIVLTTFTTNLADALSDSLTQLDPRVSQAKKLGQPGVHVTGVDALASAVLRGAGSGLAASVREVLGEDRSAPLARTAGTRWREVVESTDTSLPPAMANESFLSSEYGHIVLPNKIHDEAGYLRVRRPGRGVALDRAKRSAVWGLIAAYRAQSRIDGSLDFTEAAAVAAAHLAKQTDKRADHVLIDEGQDLSPTHWQLLRALTGEHPDDLFIAEDAHQRIYGARVVLSRCGVAIVGRSRRLTLNYRTTAQNLHYAMKIIEGGQYVDMEDDTETTGYRSARTGPEPEIVLAETLSAELQIIGDYVLAWVKAGTDAETVAVLVSDRFHRDRVVTALTERGVDARAVDRDRSPQGRVAVMTMHRAKGTEFSKVVIAADRPSSVELARLEALALSERADADLRRRSLRYVAATRARDELVVVVQQ